MLCPGTPDTRKKTVVVGYKVQMQNLGFNMGLFVYNTYVFRNPYRHPQPAMQNQLSFLKITKNDR